MKSKTAKKLIKKQALLHKEELAENWKKAEQKKQINKIAPLDQKENSYGIYACYH